MDFGDVLSVHRRVVRDRLVRHAAVEVLRRGRDKRVIRHCEQEAGQLGESDGATVRGTRAAAGRADQPAYALVALAVADCPQTGLALGKSPVVNEGVDTL